MAVVQGGIVPLSTSQTGNGDSTNTGDTGHTSPSFGAAGAGAVVITSVVGATPTVTVNILGSNDGTNFYNIPYALVATPQTETLAAIVITTAVTTTYLLRSTAQSWKYIKLAYSANTNVTLTATAYL